MANGLISGLFVVNRWGDTAKNLVDHLRRVADQAHTIESPLCHGTLQSANILFSLALDRSAAMLASPLRQETHGLLLQAMQITEVDPCDDDQRDEQLREYATIIALLHTQRCLTLHEVDRIRELINIFTCIAQIETDPLAHEALPDLELPPRSDRHPN